MNEVLMQIAGEVLFLSQNASLENIMGGYKTELTFLFSASGERTTFLRFYGINQNTGRDTDCICTSSHVF